MYVCMYECAHTCTHVYVHMNMTCVLVVHIYTCTHTYMPCMCAHEVQLINEPSL